MSQSIDILLVEDDFGDVKLTEEALKECKLKVNLKHVENGQAALDYLGKKGEYADAITPDLILLDLNMPVMDGREFLTRLRADDDFKKVPVVVLTTSEADSDITETYGLGANCYVTKPVDFIQFQKVVHEISEFWFSVVKLPTLG